MSNSYNIGKLGNSITGFNDSGLDYVVKDAVLSKNGTTVIISFQTTPSPTSAVGIVRVYRYNGIDWVQLGNDVGTHISTVTPISTSEEFGYKVSINTDGTYIAVSSPYYSGIQNGLIRLFEFSGGDWIQRGLDITGVGINEFFGRDGLSLSDDGAVFAASSQESNGVVRIYNWTGVSWSQRGSDLTGSSNDYGSSISLNSDGTIIAVGVKKYTSISPTLLEQGSIFVYEWTGASWDILGSSNGILGDNYKDQFGYRVSLSDDGFTVSGTTNSINSDYVKVFTYDISLNTWDQKGTSISNTTTTDFFGEDVALSGYSNRLAIVDSYNSEGGIQSGNVAFFAYQDDNWNAVGNITGNHPYDELSVVSITQSGDRLAVASSNATNGFGNLTGYVDINYAYQPNIISRYHITRQNTSSYENTTIQLPFINLVNNNAFQLLSEYDGIYRYKILSPFTYNTTTDITAYGNEYNKLTSIVTENATILIPDTDYLEYGNGTIMIQTTLAAGTSSTEYPIHYSIEQTENLTSYGTLIITVENDNNIQNVIDRLNYEVEYSQILKTQANQLMYERFDEVTPALLRFNTLPYGYHSSTDSHIIRLDNEWNLRSGRYTTLVDSTNAINEGDNRDIQIVLPGNAPVEQVFPIAIYRRLNPDGTKELLPNISIGSIDSTGTFVTSQTIFMKRFMSPDLPVITAGDSDYFIGIKALQYNIVEDEWELISRKPKQRTRLQHLIIKKDKHIQKHFLANDDEILLSFNGVSLQALSLRGNQIRFLTAKHYFSGISNTNNRTRVKPSRYYSLNRDNIIQSMTGQEMFEDLLGSGDVIRQTNVTSIIDAQLTNNSEQDRQNLTSAFGNTTVTYGSNSYIFNSDHQWTQELPFQWEEWLQTDDNLTLFSPGGSLPSDTQTLNVSFVLNIKIEKDSNYSGNVVAFSSTYILPTSTDQYQLDIEFAIKDRAGNLFDIQTQVRDPITNDLCITPIATSLSTEQWNRFGVDIGVEMIKSGSNWSLNNIYTRCASYTIPNGSTLDGTQKVSLSKSFPVAPTSFYSESDITHTNIDLPAIGTIDVGNLVVLTGVGNLENPDVSSNATIYLDEIEVYTVRPILSNVLGGTLLANPYH